MKLKLLLVLIILVVAPQITISRKSKSLRRRRRKDYFDSITKNSPITDINKLFFPFDIGNFKPIEYNQEGTSFTPKKLNVDGSKNEGLFIVENVENYDKTSEKKQYIVKISSFEEKITDLDDKTISLFEEKKLTNLSEKKKASIEKTNLEMHRTLANLKEVIKLQKDNPDKTTKISKIYDAKLFKNEKGNFRLATLIDSISGVTFIKHIKELTDQQHNMKEIKVETAKYFKASFYSIPVDKIVYFTKELLTIGKQLQQLKLIHMDINSQNIMLNTDNTLVLIDIEGLQPPVTQDDIDKLGFKFYTTPKYNFELLNGSYNGDKFSLAMCILDLFGRRFLDERDPIDIMTGIDPEKGVSEHYKIFLSELDTILKQVFPTNVNGNNNLYYDIINSMLAVGELSYEGDFQIKSQTKSYDDLLSMLAKLLK